MIVLDHRKYKQVWNSSETIVEAAATLGVSYHSCASWGSRYRERFPGNHGLKKMVRHGRPIPLEDEVATIEAWNNSTSQAEAAEKLGITAHSLRSRIYRLRLRDYQLVNMKSDDDVVSDYEQERDASIDPGHPVVGGVRLNNELWSYADIEAIHEWLYPREQAGHSWLAYPRHFRWMLAHNKRTKWFELREDEAANRASRYKSQGKPGHRER